MTLRLGLEGRSALVAGPHSEVGSACAARLREEGMTVGLALEESLQLGRGRVDVLVSTPGNALEAAIEATSEAAFRELLERDLSSPFRIARTCFARMRAQRAGSMILVASAAGIRADHDAAAFSVMSAGVIALAELFGAEGTPHGVRANVVCPGPGIDVASVVAWLASDQSAHVSGATLRIDGGATAAMAVDTRI